MLRSAGDGWRVALSPPGIRFSTGFLVNGIPFRPLLSDSSFGHDGASGSLGFADADSKTGFGYVNNLIAARDHRANDLTAALAALPGSIGRDAGRRTPGTGHDAVRFLADRRPASRRRRSSSSWPGPQAMLRDDQWTAIEALVVQRRRALVVQRTGWGKSAVYFIAAKLLRASGHGPTVIVSPLLALMRNQVAGRRAGRRARRHHQLEQRHRLGRDPRPGAQR